MSPKFIPLYFAKYITTNSVSCYKSGDMGESFVTIVGTRFPPKSRLTNPMFPSVGDTDTTFLFIGKWLQLFTLANQNHDIVMARIP